MKNVYFVRHAKSSWADFSLKDFDRPLNKRGKRDAPFMAEKMKELGVEPDAIISSTANRAFTTASFFAKALGIQKKDIIKEEKIYEAYHSTVLDLVRSLPEKYDTVFVFGHNPAFTNIANTFTNNYIDNIPTCGITKVVAEVENWKDFNEETAQLKEFHYPKQYFQ